MADSAQDLEDLSISVTDQLTISTASGVYLDKRLAEKSVIRPPDIGMSDVSFRKMGIQITAAKQIPELVHLVLETFYGFAAVRANTTSTKAEPYQLQDGMDLIMQFEDGIDRQMTFKASDFTDINQATAAEASDAITRYIRSLNLNGFSQTFQDFDTGDTFVRIFGGAKGPFSTVRVTGGQAQLYFQFPTVRNTALAINDTVWQVTRTVGSTLRFRWVGNSQPNLTQVLPGDVVLLFGINFVGAGLSGTYTVTNVRPPQTSPTLDSGWFEIDKLEFGTLRPVQPDTLPPPNSPPIYYSIDIATATALDVFFFQPFKATANDQPRFALAWETTKNTLKIYMPATTNVVARELEGAAHLHQLYAPNNLNGAFGSATDSNQKIEIVNDRAFRYKQSGFDNSATGGTVTYGFTTVNIDRVERENFVTTVYTVTPHGLTGVVDSFGRNLNSQIVSVTVGLALSDDPNNVFNGPYIVDPTAKYSLEQELCNSRQQIFAGNTLNTLFVDGTLPNKPGLLLFDLNQDTQEGPVRYIGVQIANAPHVVNLVSISQNGFIITATTDMPHGAIPGNNIAIAGTLYFNGIHKVLSVPTPTSFTAQSAISQVQSQVGVGTASTIVGNVRSTIIMDPSYVFKFSHGIGAEIDLISSGDAYQPAVDGSDFSPYITGVAEGRVFAQQIIDEVTALGINLNIVIVYPSDLGFGNQGDGPGPALPESDEVDIWGV